MMPDSSFSTNLVLQPQRCLTYVKDTYSPQKLEDASVECWKAMWERHSDISKPDEMKACLALQFTPQQVEEIMQAANSSLVKAKLLSVTDRALASGAYGCPWFEVTNAQGQKEPFFGSDR
jgi:glutathione S-transferase kappa 1